MSIFHDQATFMAAGDQKLGEFDLDQIDLYGALIDEESEEASDAQFYIMANAAAGKPITPELKATLLDGLLDMIVVAAGQALSLGLTPEKLDAAWAEVQRSNMSKCVDGKLIKRDDGKVLKPLTYSPPDLVQFFKEA